MRTITVSLNGDEHRRAAARARAVCTHGRAPGAPCVDCEIDHQKGLLSLHLKNAERCVLLLDDLYQARRGQP